MTSTSSVQDKIQIFINSHPEYEGKPLSEISSELVSAGVLTTEELGTLDSTSTFSIANKTPPAINNAFVIFSIISPSTLYKLYFL